MISMSEFWKTIAASLFSAVAVSAAAIWLLQASADKYIGFLTDRQLERIKHDIAEQLESLKGRIGTNEAANQLRFNRQLSFRAEQLSEFYWPVYIRLQIDNSVWIRVLGAQTPDRFPKEIGQPMEEFILGNHKEIMKIIQTKFYLAEPTPELEGDLLKYVRHISVYLAMRTTHHYDDKMPIDLKEPWPKDLFSHFKARLDEVQKEYNEMLKQSRGQGG